MARRRVKIRFRKVSKSFLGYFDGYKIRLATLREGILP